MTGADLLEALVAAARDGNRDSFGRLVTNDPDTLPQAWLAVGVYEREVAAALLLGQWEVSTADRGEAAPNVGDLP